MNLPKEQAKHEEELYDKLGRDRIFKKYHKWNFYSNGTFELWVGPQHMGHPSV